jgi:hypothetical protein
LRSAATFSIVKTRAAPLGYAVNDFYAANFASMFRNVCFSFAVIVRN